MRSELVIGKLQCTSTDDPFKSSTFPTQNEDLQEIKTDMNTTQQSQISLHIIYFPIILTKMENQLCFSTITKLFSIHDYFQSIGKVQYVAESIILIMRSHLFKLTTCSKSEKAEPQEA